jgi:asparagine N-glycosylation enzyme membrane subunit Stt3
MAVTRRARLALQVVVVAVLLLSAVLGSAARPLDGYGAWVAVGDGPLPGGGSGVTSIVDALRRLYMQQLGGPGASCGTNSPNNGCPP